MTSYQDLDWNSLNFVKNHLYRRLANPLNHALGRLLIAEHIVTDEHARAQFHQVTHNLEVALNLIKAWAALIHVHSGGRLTPDQRRYLGPEKLPEWIVAHLKRQTEVQISYMRRIFVHPETFYEALVLMTQVTAAIGEPQALHIDDAPDGIGVWVRAIFNAPASGAYIGVAGVVRRLDQQQPFGRDTLTQIVVLRALLALNGAELRVQTNEHTGAQALAVRLPTTPSEQVAVSAELPEVVVEAIKAASAPTRAEAPTAPTLAPVGLEEQAETLIIPPPGFRERLAKITAAAQATAPPAEKPAAETVENESETLLLPPSDREARLADAAPEAATPESSTPEVENRSETLLLPPTDREARLADAAPEAATPESVTPESENRSETLLLPPTGREARLADAAPDAATSESVTPEAENRSETLMLPPTNRETRLAEITASTEEPPDDFVERVSMGDNDDTRSVPPPDSDAERLSQHPESEATQEPPVEATPDQAVGEADRAPHVVEPPEIPSAKADIPPQTNRAAADAEAEGTDDAPGAPHDRDQRADTGSDTSAPNAHANR